MKKRLGQYVILIAAVVFLFPSISAYLSPAISQDYSKPFDILIKSKPIDYFDSKNPEQKIFGELEFLGGLELVSDNEHFGGYSDIRLLADDGSYLAVSDLGFWLSGKIRWKNGKLSHLENSRSAPILDRSGNLLPGKNSADAEGLEIIGNHAIVSFERDHRIEVHELDPVAFAGPVSALGAVFSALKLRGNKGLEALVAVPADTKQNSPDDRKFLAFSERSLNKAGNTRAFIYQNKKIHEFAVKRTHRFDITSADFSPDGDLYLLERRFTIADGVAMRIRRFDADAIKAGSTIEGETVLQAKVGHQIDNMEGLTIRQNDKGEILFLMISDDNHYILQRTLLLEFKLVAGNSK